MRPQLTQLRLTDERLRVPFFDDGRNGGVYLVGRKQAQFINGAPTIWQPPRRFPAFLASRASGKTHAALIKAIQLSQANPGHDGVFYARTIVEADQTHIPLMDALLQQWHERAGHPYFKSYNKGLRRYSFVNGSRLSFRPWGRPKKTRGPSIAFGLVDEIMFGEVDSGEAWKALVFSVRGQRGIQPPMPCLGWTSSPDGLKGVTRLFYERQNDPRDKDHYMVTSTMFDAVSGGWMTQAELEAFRGSCSKTDWEVEGLGRVLKPQRVIYPQYDEDLHLVDWTWRSDLPWGLAVDWITVKRGVALAVQFVNRAGIYAEHPIRGRVELPVGSWVVARELVVEQSTRPEFRAELLNFIRSCGRVPSFAATDRAAPAENHWLRKKFPSCPVESCDSKDEQRVLKGVAMVQSMLDPVDTPPRIYFSRALDPPTVKDLPGIRAAMTFYGWLCNPKNPSEILDVIDKSGSWDDPADALRYLVVQTAHRPQFHGGGALPYINPIAEEIRGGFRLAA
uniref:Terminase n=2 Tax=viral metagenome TaxID=1070528 RepID=A0A6M3J6B7_9ZZZZ